MYTIHREFFINVQIKWERDYEKILYIFITLGFIAIFILSFSSCADKASKGDLFLSDVGDCGSGINWKNFLNSGSLSSNDTSTVNEKLLDTEKTIILNGIEYSGQYRNSGKQSVYSSDIVEIYYGKGCAFEINEQSGKLTYFMKGYSKSENPIDEQTGLKIAENVLSELIDIANFDICENSGNVNEKIITGCQGTA